MRVAIVHYHLQPGGVTRIIEHSARAMKDKPMDLVVLTGKKPPTPFPAGYAVVEGLQYEADRPEMTARELAGSMVKAASEALGGVPDVWHIHNHSLGKSMILPSALVDLANQGHRLLLHIHDFAEDGRPANYRMLLHTMAEGRGAYLASQLYPSGEHIHYIVLNSRDYRFMQDAGADKANLHLLANPVELPVECADEELDTQQTSPLWIYPTRAIRRKNIGEFLLWAATAPQDHLFATTLGPDNPLERPRYERWKKVADELDLPVEFELGQKGDLGFIETLKSAKGLLTTSIAEGFGLAILEPWLVGRPVMGRSLPEITGEFCDAGIRLPWLYDRLDIPVGWLGKEYLVKAAATGLQKSLAAYGREPAGSDLERVLAAWVQKEAVDFGRLDEPMQEQVLTRVIRDPSGDGRVVKRQLIYPEDCSGVIGENCQILKSCYGLKQYGETLHALYERVGGASTTSVNNLDGEVLLDHFLSPERLQLLRVD